MSMTEHLSASLRTEQERRGEVDRVYRLIKTRLVEGEFQPGQFLSEIELARQCNASRTPIREASNRLVQDGWIKRIPHKGYLVSPISVRDILEIYEYRKLLECFAAEKATQTASADQIAGLARLVELEQNSQADLNEIVAANELFHLKIAEIAGNQRVYRQLKLTLQYVHRLDRLSTQRDRGWVPHTEILTALQARKPNEARQVMAAHIDYARDRMLNLFAG